VPSGDASGVRTRHYRGRVAHPNQRRQWSWFVLAVGLVLLVLCTAAASAIALGLGLVMVLAGLLGLLLST
jgi:hypothetical protein